MKVFSFATLLLLCSTIFAVAQDAGGRQLPVVETDPWGTEMMDYGYYGKGYGGKGYGGYSYYGGKKGGQGGSGYGGKKGGEGGYSYGKKGGKGYGKGKGKGKGGYYIDGKGKGNPSGKGGKGSNYGKGKGKGYSYGKGGKGKGYDGKGKGKGYGKGKGKGYTPPPPPKTYPPKTYPPQTYPPTKSPTTKPTGSPTQDTNSLVPPSVCVAVNPETGLTVEVPLHDTCPQDENAIGVEPFLVCCIDKDGDPTCQECEECMPNHEAPRQCCNTNSLTSEGWCLAGGFDTCCKGDNLEPGQSIGDNFYCTQSIDGDEGVCLGAGATR